MKRIVLIALLSSASLIAMEKEDGETVSILATLDRLKKAIQRYEAQEMKDGQSRMRVKENKNRAREQIEKMTRQVAEHNNRLQKDNQLQRQVEIGRRKRLAAKRMMENARIRLNNERYQQEKQSEVERWKGLQWP